MKKSKSRKPAVFLDRDGTILNERGYLSDPKKMFFYPGVYRALANLRKAGFKLVVITNQSGVGRGYFTLATLKKINQKFSRLLSARGAKIDGIYYCPHRPDAGCACRKPRPKLVKQAARELNLDIRRSFVVGDQLRDIQLAKNTGAKGILVLTGGGRSARLKAARLAVKVARHLPSAAQWILQ